MTTSPRPMLELVGLSKHFPVRNGFGKVTGTVKAVDKVSLDLRNELGEEAAMIQRDAMPLPDTA